MDKCLKRVNASFEIDLHPSRLADVKSGVQEQLNTQLMRYNDEFEGVVLSVGDFNILSEQGTVHPYFPFCRVNVKAQLLLFSPGVDSTLTGCVTKVGTDFIGLLVLGVLNASIRKDNMRKEFVYDSMAGEWRSSKHRSHVIGVGTHIKFKVVSLETGNAFFSINGSLESKKTGSIEYLEAKKSSKAEDD